MKPSLRRRPARRARLAGLAVVLLLTGALLSPVSAARAAFPGANGRIAFTHEAIAGDHTQSDVYSVRPGGTGVLRLTRTPGLNEFGPAWNATGSRIAFWRTTAPFGRGSLWVMHADGTAPKRLTTGIDARDPVWNPAGTRLAYNRDWDLFTLRATDGGGRRQLTSGGALDFEPAWSPDGQRIAFTRARQQGDPGDIFLLDLGTDTLTRVTGSPAYEHQVAWGPQGRRLVFERDGVTRSSIFTVRPDGSELRRLTSGPQFDTAPAYSPDGTKLMFSSDRGRDFPDLWLMDADGSDQRRFLDRRFPDGFPDWRPRP